MKVRGLKIAVRSDLRWAAKLAAPAQKTTDKLNDSSQAFPTENDHIIVLGHGMILPRIQCVSFTLFLE